MKEIEFLFEPMRVGSVEFKNRIFMPAMHLNYTMGGEVSERLIAFYRQRACGGVGAITIGGCPVDDKAGGFLMIGIYDDKFLPGLERFVREVKTDGVALGVQLFHAGRYAFSMLIGQQPVAPSAIASRYNPEEPRELTKDEILEIEDSFAKAAVRAKQAGFDFVEIITSAGYLVAQFLSPVSNKRTDEYGGPLENRARFGVEVIRKVRDAVGDMAVGVRLGGSDFIEGGNTNKEMCEVARMFESAGIDFIDVTGGWHETKVPQIPMCVPMGAYLYLAQAIKESVGIPVIASNRLSDPVVAARSIAWGKCDGVALGRPLIAEPDWPNKVKAGKLDEVQPCIACNQGCFDSVFVGDPVTCLVNPLAGHEAEIALEPLGAPVKVAIIGGGPAGASAAIYFKKRGADVTLFERDDRLAGKLDLCGSSYFRRDFLRLRDYYNSVVPKLGIELRLGEEATVGSVKALDPDLVVVATGARPLLPGFARKAIESGQGNIYLADDVLSGNVFPKGRVLVIGGGAVGCEAALYIAERDLLNPEQAYFLLTERAEPLDRVYELSARVRRPIVICEMLPKVAEDVGKTTRWVIMQQIRRFGIEVATGSEIVEMKPDRAVVKRGDDVGELPADEFVIAVGYGAENALADELKGAGLRVEVIGDARQPAKITDATRQALELAAGFES